MVLYDRFGRPLLHLRITVTHRCNYKCIYCHMEGESGFSFPELTPQEIYYVAKAAYNLDIRRFKLTGGEPLVRDDIVEIVSKIASLKPLDLAITTNGYYLVDYANDLVKAGLKRVNINLPALDHEVYKAITGVDGLDRVLEGIEKARRAGLNPIKLNYVYLKGVNEGELWRILNYTKEKGLILQVIELEPVGIPEKTFKQLYKSVNDIEKEFSRRAVKTIRRKYMHYRPQYHLPDGSIVEIVKSHCNPQFCKHCTRLRLTANGSFRTCLLRDKPYINITSILRNKSLSEEEIVEKIKEVIVRANILREPYYR